MQLQRPINSTDSDQCVTFDPQKFHNWTDRDNDRIVLKSQTTEQTAIYPDVTQTERANHRERNQTQAKSQLTRHTNVGYTTQTPAHTNHKEGILGKIPSVTGA